MKKGKLILLIILLIAAFVCAKILYDQVTQSQIPEDPGIAQDVDPSPAPHEEEPQISYETSEIDEIAWNYDEFPDDYTFRNNKLLNELCFCGGVRGGGQSRHPSPRHAAQDRERGRRYLLLLRSGQSVRRAVQGRIYPHVFRSGFRKEILR